VIIWLAWVLLALGTAPAALDVHQGKVAEAEVSVEHDEVSRQTVYTIRSADCRISWTAYGTTANRGVVRHRSDCGRPLGEQAPLIGLVLHKVIESQDAGWEFRTLSWGRVYGDGQKDATIAVRLASAAWRSTDWNVVSGRPKGGDINGWVRNLGRDSDIAAEPRQVFANAGLKLEIASVEKVLVDRAAGLPFYNMLSRQAVRPNDKVPFDCQLWFSVRRKERNRP